MINKVVLRRIEEYDLGMLEAGSLNDITILSRQTAALELPKREYHELDLTDEKGTTRTVRL